MSESIELKMNMDHRAVTELARAHWLLQKARSDWERYNQACQEIARKQNPRTLILLALSGGFPVDFKSILIKCLHQSGYKWSEDNNGLVIECDPKITQKYRKHLQALVKNGRVIKSKQRLVFHSPKFTLEKTYYSLRKRRAG
jgi:hypothetical protein